jgi:hypothetical protein
MEQADPMLIEPLTTMLGKLYQAGSQCSTKVKMLELLDLPSQML